VLLLLPPALPLRAPVNQRRQQRPPRLESVVLAKARLRVRVTTLQTQYSALRDCLTHFSCVCVCVCVAESKPKGRPPGRPRKGTSPASATSSPDGPMTPTDTTPSLISSAPESSSPSPLRASGDQAFGSSNSASAKKRGRPRKIRLEDEVSEGSLEDVSIVSSASSLSSSTPLSSSTAGSTLSGGTAPSTPLTNAPRPVVVGSSEVLNAFPRHMPLLSY